MKKTVALIIALMMVLSLFPAVLASEEGEIFGDVEWTGTPGSQSAKKKAVAEEEEEFVLTFEEVEALLAQVRVEDRSLLPEWLEGDYGCFCFLIEGKEHLCTEENHISACPVCGNEEHEGWKWCYLVDYSDEIEIDEEPTAPAEGEEQQPTEPAEQPAEPAEQPAEPAEQPAEGEEQQPAEPAEQPAEGEEQQPAEPAEQPAEGEEQQPAEPAEQPAEPAEGEDQPAEPAEQPAEGEDQPAEGEEQQPAEEVSIDELLDPDRSVVISAVYEDPSHAIGSRVTLVSTLTGYDNVVYALQWQVQKGDVWSDIPGANGSSYSFEITVEAFSMNWRLKVIPLEIIPAEAAEIPAE